MRAVNNNFNGGTLDTVISESNSGGPSGDAFDNVEFRKDIGADCHFDKDPVHTGARCARFHVGRTRAAASVGYTSSSMGPQKTVWGRTLLYIREMPHEDFNLVRIQDEHDKTLGSIELGRDGKIRNREGDAGGYTATATSRAALPVRKWVRIDFKFIVSTRHGHIHTKIYLDPESSASPSYDLTDDNLRNTGSGPIAQYQLGVTNKVTESGLILLDAINWNTKDYPGPVHHT